MRIIEDGYSDGKNKTQIKLTENFTFSPVQAQLTGQAWARQGLAMAPVL